MAEASIADYVLLFDAKPGQDRDASYIKVREALASAGLHATGRPGRDANEILVFVKAQDTRLHAEVQAERMADWLAGVHR